MLLIVVPDQFFSQFKKVGQCYTGVGYIYIYIWKRYYQCQDKTNVLLKCNPSVSPTAAEEQTAEQRRENTSNGCLSTMLSIKMLTQHRTDCER